MCSICQATEYRVIRANRNSGTETELTAVNSVSVPEFLFANRAFRVLFVFTDPLYKLGVWK